MGVRDWMRTRGMKEPVQGTYRLSSCSGNSGGAVYENCSMNGVVVAPGITPVAVAHSCLAPTKRWPQPGQTLPVTVDLTKPTRLHVDWDQVPTGSQLGREAAEEQARMMARDPTAVPDAAPAPPAAAAGAGVGVLGDASRPAPGTTGGGLTPEQTAVAAADGGVSLGLHAATATVLAVHDVAIPPGTPGQPPAGAADLTLDVTLADGTGYSTRMRLAFSTPTRRAALTEVGRSLPVLVDPDRRDRIMIDAVRLGPLPG